MQFPRNFLLGLLLMQGLHGEDELQEIITELRANFDKLEGYQATYEAKTETGKTATFRQGEDYKSGWAYTITELRDPSGKPTGRQETWSTGDDQYLIKAGDELVKFSGLSKLIEKFQALTNNLRLDPTLNKIKILSATYLTPTEASFSIQMNSHGPVWLKNTTKLISADDKEVILDWGALGTITIDRASGLLTSQKIEVDDGVREMKLTHWKKNPGAEPIAGLMKLDPDKAGHKGDARGNMVTPMLNQIYQALIEKIGKDPDLGDTLETTLPESEDQLVSLLHLQPIPPLRQKIILSCLGTIDKIGADLEQATQKKGVDIDRRRLLANPVLGKPILIRFAYENAKRCEKKVRAACLNISLGKGLKATGNIEKKARSIIEDAILKAYFRVDLEKALAIYLKQNQ